MSFRIHQRFWTVSFAGAGHLLSYHLGVARVLLASGHPIEAVSGSSSGAIAATVVSLLPHRLEEFTDIFLRDRGRALTTLTRMLTTREEQERSNNNRNKSNQAASRPILVVAATSCKDGSAKLFTFDASTKYDDVLPCSVENTTGSTILRAVQASCTIPTSFHPFDLIGKSKSLSYPNKEGVEINGDYFVDGSISAPAPFTPLDSEPGGTRILVSPFTGSSSAPQRQGDDNGALMMIRPSDETLALPGGDWTTRCGGEFRIRPSIQNLRSLIHSLGIAPAGVLEDWHRRGVEDAEVFVDSWKSSSYNH
jgi:predicted acylesterase/phospholipase RssA